MSQIVLTTLNARYAHASFGLRYLLANMGDLAGQTALVEFDINQKTTDILESILAHDPTIVGIGVYIWNASQSLELVAALKRLRPDVTVIVGGPEVSYETDQQAIVGLADYTITGEADLAFANLCRKLLSGKRPLQKVIPAELPEFSHGLELPYHLYTPEDIAHRVVYVEASRGCPFRCEFCLSSLDVPVRNVPLERFLAAMQSLLDRGLRQFKFVDRTFNLNLNFSSAILNFFLERYTPGLFLHFEMIPDRLPEALRALIARFPPGALQFEVGIQTFNEEVAARISRRQDNAKVEDNFRFLTSQTGVHIHADLIAGLPGEDLDSFARGFDQLVALGPQEIQVGILKRLRGTPIARHTDEFQMVYTPHAPYEVLQTRDMDFATLQGIRRFARYWDLYANSGNFRSTLPMLWEGVSPFRSFWNFTCAIYGKKGIALQHLAELLFEHLIETHPAEKVALSLWSDYTRAGRSDRPAFLRPYIADLPIPRTRPLSPQFPARQSRHLAQGTGPSGSAAGAECAPLNNPAD
jgi:radical SAM superfamily enzyme YgiQ (UPF0313 family)